MEEDDREMIESFDKTYSENKEMFGHAYQELQDYFKSLKTRGSILDVGSGQGRDSLFLATIGYKVTAIDISEVGISQMLSNAEIQGLEIFGMVGDALSVHIEGNFDFILFDMLLHSFDVKLQKELLRKYSYYLSDNGSFCIVYPEDSDKDHFLDLLNEIDPSWDPIFETIVYDVPIVDGMEDEEEFTFNLLIVRRK